MQNTQQPAPPYADDEISLIELWQILAKRKGLILACFILCLAGGAAFAFLTSPVYEASATVRIGQIALSTESDAQLLEPPPEFAARITSQHGANRTSASTPKGTTSTVLLVAQGSSAPDASESLRTVIESIKKDHDALYEQGLKPTREHLERLDTQAHQLQRQLADITQLIEEIKTEQPVQASLLMQERSQLTNVINHKDTERLRLSQQVAPPQTRPTELIGEITAPTKPSKPKKALVLALAAVLGMMGGVMLAFVAEFIAKAKANATAKA